MLNKMLDGMPTKPVLYIAPMVVILVMVYYFFETKNNCTKQSGLREYFLQVVKKSPSDSILNLSDATPFPWEKVKIFTDFKPERKPRSCWFGWWDWSIEEREKIISAGQLNVLIFVQKDTLSNYIELTNDQIKFDVPEQSLKPEEGLFQVIRSDENSAVKLSFIRSSLNGE